MSLNELMLREILDQPRLASAELGRLRQEAVAAVRRLDTPGGRIIVAGCGDSWIAGCALEPAARVLCGPARAVHVLQAFEAARYFPFQSGDVLIACSVSGEVARTIETAEVGRQAGARVIGILAQPTSTLARLSDAVVRLPEPMARHTPHSRDYLATLLALGTVFEALSEQPVPALDATGTTLAAHLPAWRDRARQLAPLLAAAPRLILLGAGPSWGSAMYGAAKLWEAGGILALAQELEEFAHGEHMLADEGDAVVLVAPSGPGSDRAAEMLGGFLELGLDVTVVGEVPNAPAAVAVVPLPAFPELWSPLIVAAPLQLLCYEIAGCRGLDVERPLGGRSRGEIFDSVHAAWTRQSRAT